MPKPGDIGRWEDKEFIAHEGIDTRIADCPRCTFHSIREARGGGKCGKDLDPNLNCLGVFWRPHNDAARVFEVTLKLKPK